MTTFTRRDFIKITSTAGAGVAVGSGLVTNMWGMDPD